MEPLITQKNFDDKIYIPVYRVFNGRVILVSDLGKKQENPLGTKRQTITQTFI